MQKYNYALKILTMVWIFTSLVSLSPKATVLSPIIQKKPEIVYYKSDITDENKNITPSRGGFIDSINLYQESSETVQVFASSSSARKVYITSSDIDLMSKVVYKESRGEPYEGKVAVAAVILNRSVHPRFPSTIEGVIKQKNAFSCVVNGKIDAKPDDSCYKAVLEAIEGADPTDEALYFYNPKIPTSSWMKKTAKENKIEIGNHLFFKQ